MTSQNKTEPTFESAIERLESIVEQMESDKMPLEDLLVRYEEGVKLVKFCSGKLEAAEKRIEIITRNAQGKPQAAEFEPNPVAGPASTKKSGIPETSPSPETKDVRLF